MKKNTLLLLFVACALFSSAQNLLTNPSFETWTDGKPDNWSVPALISHVSALTWSKETTIINDGSSSLKLVVGTTESPGIQQIVAITAGKTYTISMSYYVLSGDGSDVRIWSTFKNAEGLYSTKNWETAVSVDADIQKKLQGSGTSTGAYFKIANDTWGTYSTDFVAPADAVYFVFEVRSYKSSTTIWDNFSLTEKTTALSTPTTSKPELLVSGKSLLIKNVVDGSVVEIFSTIGSKVQTSAVENGQISIANLKKGLYIVRSGKMSQKIKL